MVLWLRFLKEVNESMDEPPPKMRENEKDKQSLRTLQASGIYACGKV